MTHTATKITAGEYSYRGFEIEHYPEIKAWNIFEIVPHTWDETKTMREYVQTWNTLRECKDWIDWAIENPMK